VVGFAGAALFALGGLLRLLLLGSGVHYAADFLPTMVLGGIGVGLVLPSLTAAAAASLPPSRLATGIAVQTTGRQLGSALGVAILVPVLGAALGRAADFAGAWELMIVAALAAGLTIAGIGRGARARAASGVAAQAPA
jgi:hypothetical protein